MLTTRELRDRHGHHGFTHADGTPDHVNSISSRVIRCLYEGTRAVAVGCDVGATMQITALVDLLHLHLTGGGTFAGQDVSPDTVTIILGGCPGGREARDALGTLIGTLEGGPRVQVLIADADNKLQAPPLVDLDLSDVALYPRWPDLLRNVNREPPALLTRITTRVNNPALRAYPMLTGRGWWSLRLEGLQVGRFCGDHGWLNVGKDSKVRVEGSPAHRGHQRTVWQQSTKALDPITIYESNPHSETSAVTALTAFAQKYGPEITGGMVTAKQSEHGLESRILRRQARLKSAHGCTLDLIRNDGIVNWGSQFPTRWGRDGSTRYLDAMLRDGCTPWALEIKVHGPGGIGQYYRHGIAQAVLYREFIRAARPLKTWFDRFHLEQSACRAALVVPDMTGRQSKWVSPLHGIGGLFDVEVIPLAQT